MRRRGVAGNRGIMFEAFESEGMGDDERKSDLDDPLDELVRLVESGVAEVYVDDLPMGDQPRVDYGEYGDEDPLVPPEEYDINAVVSDHHEMLMRMIETMLP